MSKKIWLRGTLLFFLIFSFITFGNEVQAQFGGCLPSSYVPTTITEDCNPSAQCVASSRCAFTTGLPGGQYSCEMERTTSYKTVTTSCNPSGQVVRSESACGAPQTLSCDTRITITGCAVNSDCPQPPNTSCGTYCDLSEPIGGRGACRQVDSQCSAIGTGGFYCGDGYCSAGETNLNCSADCPVSIPPPDFVVTTSPTNRAILKGGSTTYTITVNPINGYANTVLLNSVCPTGATCSITANTVRDPSEPSKVDLSYGAQDATLSVYNTSSIALGDFSIDVFGIGAGNTHHVYPQLSVIPIQPTSLTVSLVGSCPSTGIALSWTAVSGADSYKLYRNTTNGKPASPYKIVGNVSSDSDFPAQGYTYYYWIESMHSPSGNYSDARASAPIVFATCPNPPPTVTISPSATAVTVGQVVNFTVTGNSSTGLHSIGLESTNSAGTPISNLGIFYSSANTATNVFSWTPSAVGTYYFDGYAWSTALAALTRTSPVTIITVSAATPAPVVDMKGWGNTVPQASPIDGSTVMNLGGVGGLVWASSNATNCQISRDGTLLGNFPVNGVNASAGVGPMVVTSNHTITCTGPGGTSNTDGFIHIVPAVPVVTFSANPTSGASPMTTTLSWSTTNNPTSCTAGGGWSGSKASGGGSQVISGITTGTTYTLYCTNGGGNSTTASVTVTPIGAISVNISASPASMTLPTNSTTLTWTTTGSPTSCTASNYWSGAKTASGGSEVRTGMTAQTYTFTITCSKAGVPDATATVVVPVAAAPTPITISNFSPYYTSITNYPTINSNSVYWTTTGSPTSCVATGAAPWGDGSGTIAVNASRTTGSHYQGASAYPSVGTYTYTLTCSKAGVADATATFNVPVSAAGSPNLTSGAATPSSTATSGTPLTFSATITNNGNASTGASFSNFFQVATAAAGGGTITDLASASMSTLAAGASGTATSPSYTFPSSGTYSVRACADKTNSSSAGTIAESNEADNCGSWTPVTVSAGAAVTACPSGEAYVASKSLGTLRNDFSGWVGTRIQIGASPRTVTALGRVRVGTNTGTHVVKLVNESTGADIAGGSVSINMSSGTAGQYVYATLAAPLTLAANTSYYVFSQEVNGGDQWYNDTDTQVFPGAYGTIPGAAYGFGPGQWWFNGTPNRSYVPVDLCTTAYTAPPAPSRIVGKVCKDDNQDGVCNNGEVHIRDISIGACTNPSSPQTGFTVSYGGPASGTQLLNICGTLGDPVFDMTSLPSGTYSVVLGLPAGWSYVASGCQQQNSGGVFVTCASGSTAVVNVTAGGTGVVLFAAKQSAATQYTLTVAKTIGGTITTADGHISCGSACTHGYNQGTFVTLRAVPSTGYWKFVGWGGACSGSGTGECVLNMDGNKSVTAQFRPKSLLYQEF